MRALLSWIIKRFVGGGVGPVAAKTKLKPRMKVRVFRAATQKWEEIS